METVIQLIQDLMLPQLQKDNHFSKLELSTTFWKEYASQLIQFEEEAQPLYATIYKLELQDPELLISKIPEYYNVIVKELAEYYVLDHTSEPIEYLLKVQNDQFLKEVQSLKMLQQAIKKVERKRIKDELPSSYNRLVFELSEKELELATKKKGREDLKIKMQQWSKELESEEEMHTNYSIQPQENRKINSRKKVISLSWVKYAVAACLLIFAGIFYFKNLNFENDATENKVVVSDEKEVVPEIKTPNVPVNEEIKLAEIDKKQVQLEILYPSALGYSSTSNPEKITLNFIDPSKRILSLQKALKEDDLKKTLDINTKKKYQLELKELVSSNDYYLFNGESITLYKAYNSHRDIKLLSNENQYFIKYSNEFFTIIKTQKPVKLVKVINPERIEALEKTEYENE